MRTKEHLKPKISVIIPVYNVEAYLQDCIDSLLNQTMDGIEYIFVNDASPDNCIKILRENEEKYPDKIRVIDSKENLCQGGARNLGIRAARADYIGFVDSDDIVLPHMYSKLYQRALETDADVVFIQYARVEQNYILTESDISKNVWTPLFKWNQKLLNTGNKLLNCGDRMHLIAYPIGGVYCGIWKRELIEKSGVYFPEHLRYEDNYWMNMIACYLSKVSFVEEVGYLYRRNWKSTVNSRNQKYQFDRLKIEKMLLDDVKSTNNFELYYDAWEYIFTFRYVFNSFYMYLFKFDEIPIDVMLGLLNDLKVNFPKWEKNPYYIEMTPKWKKIRNKAVTLFPKVMIKIYPSIDKYIRR